MNRPLTRRLVPLSVAIAATASLSACATFADDNVAARVGDAELSADDFSAILRDAEGDEATFAPMNDPSRPDATRPGDATDLLSNWIVDHMLRADLAAAGVAVSEPSAELTAAAVTENLQSSVEAWSAQPTFEITDDDARDLYEQGVQESGIICVSTIILINGAYAEGIATDVRPEDAAVEAAAPATLAFANELRDQIVSGEQTFDEVAAQFANGERADVAVESPGCMQGAQFVQDFSVNQPEYVDAAIAATIGEVDEPTVAPYGAHLIRLIPFEELPAGALDAVLSAPITRFDVLSRRTDVYVDPRYGTFDGPDFVVPLG